MKQLILLTVSVWLFTLLPLSAAQKGNKRFDFSNEAALKKNWQHKGKRLGIPLTTFTIVPCKSAKDKRALAVAAARSTGFIATRIPRSVWSKYPVMRWRWRIIRKVSFSGKEPDDQAAVIYFGDGTVVKQNLLAYRWEDSYALGSQSMIKYGMGATTVFRICMRNRKAVLSRWYEEERNVVDDFRKAFGRPPQGECALTIGANSQYSKSNTLVEIDFIEFRPAPALPGTDANKIAERNIIR